MEPRCGAVLEADGASDRARAQSRKNVTCSWAMRAVALGMTTEAVAAHLGHANPATTATHYARIARPQVEAEVMRAVRLSGLVLSAKPKKARSTLHCGRRRIEAVITAQHASLASRENGRQPGHLDAAAHPQSLQVLAVVDKPRRPALAATHPLSLHFAVFPIRQGLTGPRCAEQLPAKGSP
jgi:hypothetical protein